MDQILVKRPNSAVLYSSGDDLVCRMLCNCPSGQSAQFYDSFCFDPRFHHERKIGAFRKIRSTFFKFFSIHGFSSLGWSKFYRDWEVGLFWKKKNDFFELLNSTTLKRMKSRAPHMIGTKFLGLPRPPPSPEIFKGDHNGHKSALRRNRTDQH